MFGYRGRAVHPEGGSDRRDDAVFSLCAAYVISLFKRVPYIFELRDFWPESIEAVGAMWESPALRLLVRLELFL